MRASDQNAETASRLPGFSHWDPVAEGGRAVTTDGRRWTWTVEEGAIARYDGRWTLAVADREVSGAAQGEYRAALKRHADQMTAGSHSTNSPDPRGGSPVTTPATSATTAPASEARGVRTLCNRLDEIGHAHAQVGSGEGFLGSLNDMEVGEGDKQKVADAQEASRNAAAAWANAAATVRRNNMPVQEAYATSPDAANKHANTNE